MSFIDFFKTKDAPPIIEFVDKLRFLGFKYDEIIPQNDFKLISRHCDIGGHYYIYIGLLNKFIIYSRIRSAHFTDTPYYWTYEYSARFTHPNIVDVDVYLYDLSKSYPNEDDIYNVIRCLPIIVQNNKVVKPGKWIEFLESYMDSIDVRGKMIANRKIINEIENKNECKRKDDECRCHQYKQSIINTWK